MLQTSAVAGASAAAVALVGCGDSGSERDTPHSGGTLRFGSTVPPSFGLDPHVENAGALAIVARTYGYPHHGDPRTDEVVLDHLASYEQPDATTYALRMRQDVRFHAGPPADGRAVTGDDVVLSMRRYRDSALTVNKFWHKQILTGEGAPDPSTIIVTTARPYVYSMAEMGALNAGAILPREAIEQGINLASRAPGSGPFALASAEPKVTTLAAYAGYHAGAPLLAGMQWRLLNSTDELYDALRARTIDVAPASGREESNALGEEVDGLDVFIEPSLAWLSLALGTNAPALRDDRVRRAIDLALDREALIAAAAADVDGVMCGPVNQHLADGFWSLSHDELTELQGGGSIEDRRAEAAELVRAAGAENALITLQVAQAESLPAVAASIREQLARIGLRVTVELRPVLAWYVASRSGEFEASLIAHPPYETPDGALRWYHSGGPDGDGNPMGLADAALDGDIEAFQAESDREQRRELALAIQRAALGTHALLPLFTRSSYTLAHTYVRDGGFELPGSLSRYHYTQWLDLPVEGRAD